jgi:hypothetical protein
MTLAKRYRYLVERVTGYFQRRRQRAGLMPRGRQAVQGRGTFTIAAVVTRADGTVEDRGIIARGET